MLKDFLRRKILVFLAVFLFLIVPFTSIGTIWAGGGGSLYTLTYTTIGPAVVFTVTPPAASSLTVEAKDSAGTLVFSSIISTGGTTATWNNPPAGTFTANLLSGGVNASVPITVTTTFSSNGSFSIPGNFQPANRFSTFGKLAGDIILILVSIGGALALMFIVIAGIKYVTASGDSKKLASATSTLTYALIGLAVAVLAFVILAIVQYFFHATLI